MQDCARIALADRDGQLVARCGPAAGGDSLDAQSLRALVGDAGFGDWALSDDALAALLLRCASDDAGFEQVIAERRDAEVCVEVAADATEAWIDVVPARGGCAATIDGLAAALAAAGVVHGVQADALAQASASVVPLRVIAALATPPRPGEDTRFELLVADTRDRRPKVDEHGRVDFHELGDIPIVRPRQPLMRRHPATPGTDGRNVRGEAIAARPGLDQAFDAHLVGVALSDEDPNLLVALVVGQPVHADRSVMVEQVLHLKDVGLNTGNISFDGTVEIGGDVHPGMKVEATGDIVVTGLVEGAVLSAAGGVRVACGVIAKSVVVAGQSFAARFVEHSEVRAGHSISIDDTAVHCDLQARSAVQVGLKSRQRGRLVGGSTLAMHQVVVPMLGAVAGGLTRVQVGVDPVLEAHHRALLETIEARKADEVKLDRLVKHLQTQGDPRGMLDRVMPSWQQALKALGESLQELTEVEARLALAASARVEVLLGIEGDVDLAFGGTWCHLRRRFGPGSFDVDANGRAAYHPVAGETGAIG